MNLNGIKFQRTEVCDPTWLLDRLALNHGDPGTGWIREALTHAYEAGIQDAIHIAAVNLMREDREKSLAIRMRLSG